MNIHECISKELTEKRSLAALIWLVDRGREVEFAVDGCRCFISRNGAEKAVSLWWGQNQQSFDSMEELLGDALIGGSPFLAVWKDARIQTLF